MDHETDWDAYVQAQARLLALELDEARRAQVIVHLARIAELARPLLEFEQDRQVEPAPVFRA